MRRAPLAQLDRASGYEPGGRRFESCRARHSFQELTGSALTGVLTVPILVPTLSQFPSRRVQHGDRVAQCGVTDMAVALCHHRCGGR